MSYRDQLSALKSRKEALEAEMNGKARELAEARKLLAEAEAHARRPVLENIHVASPCKADWNQMQGDERVRACGLCNKNVYNLSELTREEAEALIVEKEGKLCVRYFQRQDGTILLKDCSLGAKARRRRRLAAIAAGAAMLAAGAVVVIKRVSPTVGGASALMGDVISEPVSGQVAVSPPPPMMGAMAPMPEVEGPPRELAGAAPIEVKGDLQVHR